MWNAAASARALARFSWLLLVFVATGCRQIPPTVKIGLVAPFEGRWRDVGYDAIYAARLAVREVNENGGVAGHRIELVALDDGGDPQLALEAAASLAADPALVVAMGHWLPQTTSAVAPLYAEAGIPLLMLGVSPLDETEPALLPERFLSAYEAVTPFDERAGTRAGATYDATWLALNALRDANTEGPVTRETVASALQALQYDGVTGTVFQPAVAP